MMKVFVSRRIPEEGLALLRQACQVTVAPQDGVISRAALEEGVRTHDALICMLNDRIDAALLGLNPGLKGVCQYAVGVNNIDLAAASQRKIPVTNTPGVLTDCTADLAWALLLDAARRVTEGDRFTRAGKFSGLGPQLMLGRKVTGKTLGIVGMGRIGEAVAERAKGFRMSVLYTKRKRVSPEREAELNARHVELTTLLRESDFVSLHCPLSPETTHLIGARELALMKPSACLVNTSRGPVVDEKALVKALAEGRLAAAGLDVYEEEPLLAPGLAALENAVLPPHLGSATLETRAQMAVMVATNMLACLKGELPPNLVNSEAFA